MPLLESTLAGYIAGVAVTTTSQVLQWLKRKYEDCSTDVQENARRNTCDFFEYFVSKYRELELEIDGLKDKIAENVKKPEVALMVKQAVLDASQIEDKDKQKILAELIIERLTSSDSESSIYCRVAASHVLNLSPKHLQALGFYCAVRWDGVQETSGHDYLKSLLGRYTTVGPATFDHLSSSGLVVQINHSPFSQGDEEFLIETLSENKDFDFNDLKDTVELKTLAMIVRILNVRRYSLTPVGMRIGMKVHQILFHQGVE